MSRFIFSFAAFVFACSCSLFAADQKSAKTKSRGFLFTYAATVTGLEPGKTARIWLPVPQTNEDQEVTIAREDLPAQGKLGRDVTYGNKILYVEATAGEKGTIPLSIAYRVQRREVKADLQKMDDDMENITRFLQPDKRVPIDGKCLALLAGRQLPEDQVKLGRVLYDAVNDHMRCSKEGAGWGFGDVEWACDNGYGNCSDFHSLFISLARAKKIPAKFEIGFPLPEKRGQGDVAGYHCWAKFKPKDKGWIPVDISEADKNPKMKNYYFGNLTEDRVAFSVGRDITLEPKQSGPPLNFFIYPYVEVDGKPYSSDKVQRKFAFEDVK